LVGRIRIGFVGGDGQVSPETAVIPERFLTQEYRPEAAELEVVGIAVLDELLVGDGTRTARVDAGSQIGSLFLN
jgi:hypothetical protein